MTTQNPMALVTAPRPHVLIRSAALSAVFTLLGGCGTVPTVQAWEKGNLARPEMGFERDSLDAKFTDHIYFSKEAASGGTGVGGGGCGCN